MTQSKKRPPTVEEAPKTHHRHLFDHAVQQAGTENQRFAHVCIVCIEP